MAQLSITTTQNVNINFNTAGPGERVLASIIDIGIIWAYYIVIIVLIINSSALGGLLDSTDQWVQWAVYTIIGLPPFLYSLLFETFMEGQSPGKRILKIKVIKIDGYQAGFSDYLIRWIFRTVEVSPPMGIIGLITMIINKEDRRLGDLAAGTAVISLKNNVNISHTILRELSDSYVPVYPLVIKLSDNDVRIIKDTYEASYRQADFAMMQKLQDKIEAVTGIKAVGTSSTAFVDTVLKDYNYYTQNM
ncbi:RDD family protein [Flavobacterium sp. RHBU_3]|uniref:RDD family protein n=1 Tax=Flavobacterium sp. RHBU_3 TaxID=3391184 RepID=UPI0039852977